MSRLIIVAGPTAVGKTAYAIRLAQKFHTHVLSCDSRQFYCELRIGVARPSDSELSAAPHHFIACRPITSPYNIYDYEHDAMQCLATLFRTHDTVVAVGGSGLYIDALLASPARLPSPSPELRSQLQSMPLEEKRAKLRLLDPDYYAQVDLRNPVRLQRALEVCLTAGLPYSCILANQQPEPRPFDVEIRILTLPPPELRLRINRRVDAMIANDLLDEVRALLPMRHQPTLRTVGYRELFPVLDGIAPLDQAIDQTKLHTWQYARRQLTWLRRYPQAIAIPAE
ncbi:MAG: tRNA (adenosine(37)-N6)-dimethylallyltransferase MiaA [Bacteroidales bacterium]|nr:tRNA (adenosine(37)-N6)-dimethylallyltransferase MiaA [Bacteroidales bacterium]